LAERGGLYAVRGQIRRRLYPVQQGVESAAERVNNRGPPAACAGKGLLPDRIKGDFVRDFLRMGNNGKNNGKN
jgi:hypothetical protein